MVLCYMYMMLRCGDCDEGDFDSCHTAEVRVDMQVKEEPSSGNNVPLTVDAGSKRKRALPSKLSGNSAVEQAGAQHMSSKRPRGRPPLSSRGRGRGSSFANSPGIFLSYYDYRKHSLSYMFCGWLRW